MTPEIQKLIAANASRWERAIILPARVVEVRNVALRLVAPSAKAQYQAVQAATGVPWWVVAVIHEREAGQDWKASIAQGDPWNKISKHVPKGRGPFKSWFDAAVDALNKAPPFAARWTDWSVGGTLTLLELYNGLGYEEFHNEPSPYDWGATTIEKIGKYVGDGRFNPAVWDTQVGCAAMLKKMMELDSSIQMKEAA